LAALALVGLVVALGRWGGLGAVLGALPEHWRVLRYPTKAFFTVHLAVSLLATLGLDAIGRAEVAARRAAIALAALGAPLVLAPALIAAAPAATAWFVAHFFPPALPPDVRLADLQLISHDAM